MNRSTAVNGAPPLYPTRREERRDDDEMKAAEELNNRLVDRALEVDGTCTGEHAIGLRKIASLQKELGDAVDVMRAVKRAIDPFNIMNPGKVLSDEEPR